MATEGAGEVVGGREVCKLQVGSCKVVLEVTSEDGTTKKYEVTVVRLSGDNASLRELGVSTGHLKPPFAVDVLEYTLELPSQLAELNISTKTADDDAKLTVNGTPAACGGDSGTVARNVVPLSVGATRVEVEISSASGNATQTYVINVCKAWLDTPPRYPASIPTKELAAGLYPVCTAFLFQPTEVPGSAGDGSDEQQHVFCSHCIKAFQKPEEPKEQDPLNGKQAVGEGRSALPVATPDELVTNWKVGCPFGAGGPAGLSSTACCSHGELSLGELAAHLLGSADTAATPEAAPSNGGADEAGRAACVGIADVCETCGVLVARADCEAHAAAACTETCATCSRKIPVMYMDDHRDLLCPIAHPPKADAPAASDNAASAAAEAGEQTKAGDTTTDEPAATSSSSPSGVPPAGESNGFNLEKHEVKVRDWEKSLYGGGNKGEDALEKLATTALADHQKAGTYFVLMDSALLLRDSYPICPRCLIPPPLLPSPALPPLFPICFSVRVVERRVRNRPELVAPEYGYRSNGFVGQGSPQECKVPRSLGVDVGRPCVV